MKIGCFALIDPFQTLEHQLKRIADMGFECADVTDNHSGGLLGKEFGFNPTVSLDDNPADIKRLFAEYNLTITTVCAHASLLDPPTPARYGTNEIMKAIKLAALMGVDYVVTTEGEAHTPWSERLGFEQRVLVTAEKLYEPLRLAEDLGVHILLEPHGPLTDTIEGMKALFETLGNHKNLGINLDTGNTWLAGTDPVQFATTFKDKIHHVHWKDYTAEWEPKRGTLYGALSATPIGDGVIDIAAIYEIVKNVEYATFEVGGDENLIKSRDYMQSLGA
jgi:inosose dehydratase